MPKLNNENRDWYLFDAEGQRLGRLSTEIANHLRGKNKVLFRDNYDNGDYVVVLNCAKIELSGNKENDKVYRHHTGYLGNLKTVTFQQLKASKPEEIIKRSVLGMLPKNKLRDQFIKRLKIYPGAIHPHQNIKFKNK